MIPWIAGKFVFPLHEKIVGRKTFEFYRQMLESQWWSPQKMKEYQLQRLELRVAAAMKNTPAYANLAGLDPSWRPQSLDDLQKLPLLDKTTLAKHREALTDHTVPGGPIKCSTGGSTGVPLHFFFDRRRQAYDKAARMRAHQWFDVLPGDREAYIWGASIELSRQDKIKRLRDWLTNDMLLSSYDFNSQTIGHFVGRLKRFSPKCLFGYPTGLALLCRLANEAGISLKELAVLAVFCTAEVLQAHQKQLISDTIGSPVINNYGSRDAGFIAHECPHGRMHITSDNMIVEFLRDGKAVKPGEDGQIVVTHLENYAMPFLRYRTGDIAQPSDEVCPCGRGLAVMQNVQGRVIDYLIAVDGRWMPGLAMTLIILQIPGIAQYQIVQETIERVVVRLVKGKDFPADGEPRIVTGMKARLGQSVQIEIRNETKIEPEKSGKFRFVISYPARDRQPLMG